MTQTLEQWNEQFGTNEDFAEPSRSRGFSLDLEVAYPVSVKTAKICTSKRGSRQIELTLNVLQGDNVAGETRIWLELPKQPATDDPKDRERWRKRVLRRRDDLRKVYGSADGARFAIYKECVKNDAGLKEYIGHDGAALKGEAYTARERAVNQAMMDYGDELHGHEDGHVLDELADTFFYISKAPNKDYPEYPHTNVYGTRPEKLPMFGE